MKTDKIARGTALLLSALLTAASLSGCAEKTASVSTNGSKLTLNGKSIYPIRCEDTLSCMMSTSSQWSSQYANFGDTPIAKKLSENTGVSVSYIHPEAGKEAETLSGMLAAGNLPDMIRYNWNSYEGGAQKAAADGYILSLGEMMKAWSPALSAKLEENPEWNRGAKSSDGLYYTYPFFKGDNTLTVGSGLMLRNDWLQKCGLSSPETVDDWEKTLTAFKNECGASKPLAGTQALYLMACAYGTPKGWYHDGGTVKYGCFESGYKDFVQKMADWYAKGLIDPEIAETPSKTIDAGFLSGDIGAVAGRIGSSLGKYLNTAKTAEGMEPEFDILPAAFPVLQSGTKPEYGTCDSDVLPGMGTAISANCRNTELAARFLDYGYTEEGQTLFNFGIRGESFNFDGEYPKYTDLILNNPEGLSVDSALSAYTFVSGGPTIQKKEFAEQYYPFPAQAEALTVWNSDMTEHRLPDAVSENQPPELSETEEKISEYADEMTIKFITGKKPISEYPDFTAQLENMGIRSIIQSKQKAYDEYLLR